MCKWARLSDGLGYAVVEVGMLHDRRSSSLGEPDWEKRKERIEKEEQMFH